MLQYRRRLNYLLLFIVAAGIFTMAGCKKDNAGPSPSIKQIRSIHPAPDDSVLTSALPGQLVVIQGANLASTQQVYFDGFRATINSGLFSDNNLVVMVPVIAWDSIPAGKLNTLDVITASGKVTYTFPITAPKPAITYISNEMAVAGSSLVINGNSFYGITKIIFPGGIAVTNFTVTGLTQITVTVPSGITQGGTLQVVGQFGTGISSFSFNDMVTGILCNFDNINTWGYWGLGTNGVISDATLFPGNQNNYARMSIASVGAGDWGTSNNNGRYLSLNAVQWVPVANVDDDPAKWLLKFEIFVKNPWAAGCLFIHDDKWGRTCRYEPWKATGTPYTTTGWTTVTLPLSQFLSKVNGVDGSGTPATTITQLLELSGGATGKAKLVFAFANPTIAVANLDMAIDNIRIVKK